jgi:hypothetical protein
MGLLSDYSEDTPEARQNDEELLNEIRDTYTYFYDAWTEIRDERNVDIAYVCGDPWSTNDRKAREDAKRPCISHDELSQYVNQCVNSVRQNKRGIKIDPRGEGTDDKTAEIRQDLIRTIEYECNAPSIYCQSFQSMVEGSYAFHRVSSRYVDDESDDQEVCIKPIPNPNSVLYDPTCKEPDWSDARRCFVLELVPKADFKRRYPKASVTDFTAEHMRVAKDWIRDKDVLTAEYWRVESTWVKPTKKLRRGLIEKKEVWQYITNGIEILKRTKMPGTHLGIIPMIGLERYLDDSEGLTQRKLFSLVRLARDPQMSLAYLCSQEMEEAGLTPKTPYKGYKGQFESAREAWENCTKVPYAFLEADIIIDGAEGKVLPLPQREQFTPNFQQYEIAKDSCRRAVQAAMGISPLPTAAQRNNEKSGIALKNIQNEQAIGSFHFVDGYDRAVRLTGIVVEEWIKDKYDTEREMHLRRADESHYKVRINTPEPYTNDEGQQAHYPISADISHYVTVSTGPSYDSQRDSASQFGDLLVQNLETLPASPPQKAKLLSLVIRLKNLGPLGDEMAEIISPAPGDNLQQLQQAQAGLQQAQQLIQQLQQELQKLGMEKQAHVVEGEYRLQQEKLKSQTALTIEQLKIEAQTAAAEITTKSQQLGERIKFVEDVWKQLHGQAHDVAMQAHEQAADQQAAEQAAEAAAQQQQAQPDQSQPDQSQQETSPGPA